MGSQTEESAPTKMPKTLQTHIRQSAEVIRTVSIYSKISWEDAVQWNLDLRKPDLRKNLDLRKIVGTTNFLVHKLFDLRKIFQGLLFDLRKIFYQKC